jgi:dolichol-phosphate mannosyltransferase
VILWILGYIPFVHLSNLSFLVTTSVSICNLDKLAIVMPVHNEEESIRKTLVEWIAEIQKHTCHFVFICIDDGSVDRSLYILRKLANEFPDHFYIIRQSNQGHGAACFAGYQHACESGATWVLQIDSDGQCDCDDFANFWACRTTADVVYGRRSNRKDGVWRILGSYALRLALRLATGEWFDDANVPFRLMQAAILKKAIAMVDPDVVLKNVGLCVVFRKTCLAEKWIPILFNKRAAGQAHAGLLRLGWRIAISFSQMRSLTIGIEENKRKGQLNI